MKVRIRQTPLEPELDGVRLDRLRPGNIRDMPPVLAAWLVTERYADVEMRRDARNADDDFSDGKDIQPPFKDPDGPRRRSDDY